MVMSLGCAPLAGAVAVGLAVRFLATVSPSIAGPSIGGVCADGKLGIGKLARVSMLSVSSRAT